MKKQKLSLEELMVKSFITELNYDEIKSFQTGKKKQETQSPTYPCNCDKDTDPCPINRDGHKGCEPIEDDEPEPKPIERFGRRR